MAPTVRARKGFLDLLPERNGDSAMPKTGTGFYPITISSVVRATFSTVSTHSGHRMDIALT